jgi:hypothetical protein
VLSSDLMAGISIASNAAIAARFHSLTATARSRHFWSLDVLECSAMKYDHPAESVRELAENLAAAYTAFAMRSKSIDRIKKQYLRDKLSPLWIDLAGNLLDAHKDGLMGV